MFCIPLGVPKTLFLKLKSYWPLSHVDTCTNGTKPWWVALAVVHTAVPHLPTHCPSVLWSGTASLTPASWGGSTDDWVVNFGAHISKYCMWQNGGVHEALLPQTEVWQLSPGKALTFVWAVCLPSCFSSHIIFTWINGWQTRCGYSDSEFVRHFLKHATFRKTTDNICCPWKCCQRKMRILENLYLSPGAWLKDFCKISGNLNTWIFFFFGVV